MYNSIASYCDVGQVRCTCGWGIKGNGVRGGNGGGTTSR